MHHVHWRQEGAGGCRRLSVLGLRNTHGIFHRFYIYLYIFISSTFLLLRKNAGAAANEDTVLFRNDPRVSYCSVVVERVKCMFASTQTEFRFCASPLLRC